MLLWLAVTCTFFASAQADEYTTPTDKFCVNENNDKKGQTYCGVTFYCRCEDRLPTMLQSYLGCGYSDESEVEWHPLWFKDNDEHLPTGYVKPDLNDIVLLNKALEKEDDDDYELGEEEDADSFGCGDLTRLVTFSNIWGTHYVPSNMLAMLKRIHRTTKGQCSFKNRDNKGYDREHKYCKEGNLKPLEYLETGPLMNQQLLTFSMKVQIEDTEAVEQVIKHVGRRYSKFGKLVNPCKPHSQKGKIICHI